MSVTLSAEPSILRVDDAGTIRVGSTRVTLDTLVAAFHAGATPEQMAQDYTSLELGEIYSAIGYYLGHRAQLDGHLARQQQQAEEFRSRNPGLYTRGVRERLLARRGENRGG